jgi:type I restriction enzyme S subunit
MEVEPLLGLIPDTWEYAALGNVCERGGGGIQTGPFGTQLHASDYATTGVPSIMPQNIGDNRIVEEGIARISRDDAERLSRYLVRKGDIVYSRRGDVERRALVGLREDGWLCGTGCLRIRLGAKGVDPVYASYYLGHPSVREWIVRHAHGATMPNLNTSILSACPFVVPTLLEQRAIAHILGTLDDKIELNRRMNETLEAMARALFKSWFVDFDPVRAKAEGRDPGLPQPLADLFPARLVDSELGEIPEGWEVGSLLEVADLLSGGTPNTSISDYWDGDIPWVSAKDVSAAHGRFVMDTER